MQNGGDVLLVGHEVDHGDLPLLPHQQVAAAGQGVLAGQLRDLLQAHALIGVILRAVETGEKNTVPARQFGDVVKAIAAFDAPGQQLPLVRVPQAADNGLHAPGQKLRRQDVQQLGGPGGVGIHVAGQVQSLLPGPVQQSQHLGDLAVPVVPAHGLQVGDMHRGLQGPGHLHHLPGGLHHAAALLAHVDGDGDALPRQGGQGPDQLVGGIEALRRIAQAQGHAQGPVGQSPLQPPVNGGVVLRLQALHLIPGHAGPDGAGSRQHPRVQGGCGLGGEILRQGLPGRLRRHPAADGLQIRGDGRQVLRPHWGAG